MADSKAIRDLKFDALRNAIYHSSRRGFFDTLTRTFNFIVIAGGTAAVADLGAAIDVAPWVFAAIVTLAGISQLVFDFGGKARTHEFLQRRFYELNAEIAESASSESALARWEALLSRLYAEEPPPMRALDAVSYNAAAGSMGLKVRVVVTWWQSFGRQFFPFNKAEFPIAKRASVETRAPSA